MNSETIWAKQKQKSGDLTASCENGASKASENDHWIHLNKKWARGF